MIKFLILVNGELDKQRFSCLVFYLVQLLALLLGSKTYSHLHFPFHTQGSEI